MVQSVSGKEYFLVAKSINVYFLHITKIIKNEGLPYLGFTFSDKKHFILKKEMFFSGAEKIPTVQPEENQIFI
jgi:hypothetical protein